MNSIILLAAFAVAVFSILAVLFFVVRLISAGTNAVIADARNSQWNKYMNRLENIIQSNVIATDQTFVGPLKETNSFFPLDKDEAFESCREKIYKLLGEDKNLRNRLYLDNLDPWILSRIEYYVRMKKQKG